MLAVLRGLLRSASVPYGLVVRLRNALYSRGWRGSRRAPVPVLSVGNITAGGTGKTPLVAWLARLMIIHNLRPAVLSRGYGRQRGDIDDENVMLAGMLQDVPVVVNPDRVAGAKTAVRRHDADVLILDDGFQHRRIARDLDIVLIDSLCPFGGRHLLPRGLLREPLKELRRADLLLLTRTSLVEAERREELKEELEDLAPAAPVARCRNVPSGLRRLGAGPDEVGRLRTGDWAAFCGIGNPDAFRLTLERLGCRLALFREFSDHQRYEEEQLRELQEAAAEAGCDGLVTTEKDAVKVAGLLEPNDEPAFYALQVELEFTEGSAALTTAILEAVGKTL